MSENKSAVFQQWVTVDSRRVQIDSANLSFFHTNLSCLHAGISFLSPKAREKKEVCETVGDRKGRNQPPLWNEPLVLPSRLHHVAFDHIISNL